MFAQDLNELGYLASQWPLDNRQPTLLMVHGAGMNHAQWQQQLTGLREHANVLAVDLPGHALSAHHEGNQSITGYADTLSELTGNLECGPLILAGHSMGGAVCLEFAMRYPQQLAGLVLMNTGARLKVAPALLEQIEQDYPGFVREMTRHAIADQTAAPVSDAFTELLLQSEHQAVLNDFASCDTFDRLEQVQQIQCPALVISSDQDTMTPAKYGRFLADQLPRADFTLIEGAAHISPMEQPEAVNAAIARFLHRFH